MTKWSCGQYGAGDHEDEQGGIVMSVARKTSRVVATATIMSGVIVGTATSALADYTLNGNVTYRILTGSSGPSGVYKAFNYSVNGSTQVCVRSASASSANPTDASQFSAITIIDSNGNRYNGGYGSIAVGDRVEMFVNTDAASPITCNGKKLAYIVRVYKNN